MLKIEHIGIAVKNIEDSEKLFTALLGFPSYKVENVASENVKTLFYRLGESKIELLEGLGEGNVISRFIEKKGEGIHHIAFEVENINIEIERLLQLGFDFVSEIPRRGAENKLVCFLHPRSVNGILIELCQEIE